MGLIRLGALGIGATLLAKNISKSHDEREERRENARREDAMRYQPQNNYAPRDPPPNYQYQQPNGGYAGQNVGGHNGYQQEQFANARQAKN